MLELFDSNRLDILAGSLTDVLRTTPLADPFAKEIIVVSDPSVARWLNLRFARDNGIAANIRYLMPPQFIAELYRLVDPGRSSGTAFDPSVLRWKIFQCLGDDGFTRQFPELALFLGEEDVVKRFDLASRVATLFDKYLVYRMEWIAQWETTDRNDHGPDERWQRELWTIIRSGTGEIHRAELYRQLLARVAASTEGLPERVSVFGVSSLSPAYSAILRSLGERIPVSVYALNPSRSSWYAPAVTNEEREFSPALLQFTSPSTLLGSLGKQGRDFYGALLGGQVPITRHSSFEHPADDSLLHALQRDILDGCESLHAYREGDASFQIQSCHTPMREVEVMYDRLLDLLDRTPDLKPSEIMVLAPDINDYAAYIEAVFPRASEAVHGVHIPFEIADRIPSQIDPVVEAWLQLLEFAESRCEADRVIDLLRLEPIARRFGIAGKDLGTIAGWIARSGIRWGSDGESKKEFDLPAEEQNTWEWGVRRMVLGVALPESVAQDGRPFFHSILPYDTIEGGGVPLLENFIRYVESLRGWVIEAKSRRTLTEWGAFLNTWLDCFVASDRTTVESREVVRGAWTRMMTSGTDAKFSAAVDFRVVRSILRDALGEDRQSTRFLSGGVVCASIRPSRTFPCRVMYLLGMGDGEFPRDRRPPGFDLMKKYYRAGDRSARADDRYAFLELLMSARDAMIVSCVGEDVHTGGTRPLSPLMNEVLDVAGRIAFVPSDDSMTTARMRAEAALVVRHPLQPFSPRYFRVDGSQRLFSYSADACRISKAVESSQRTHHILFPTPLPPIEGETTRVRLADLVAFYRNPARYLLKNRLRITLVDEQEGVENCEPLAMGKAERNAIKTGVVHAVETGETDMDSVYNRLRCQGVLPSVISKKSGFDVEIEGLKDFIDEFRRFRQIPRLPSIRETVPIGAWRLEIETGELTDQGFIGVHQGVLGGKILFPFWIRFLAACTVHPRRTSGTLQGMILGLSDKDGSASRVETFRQPEHAEELLATMLEWFTVGSMRPIHFFPRMSWEFAKDVDEEGGERRALEKAVTAFERETGDTATRLVFDESTEVLDDEFVTLAKALIAPALRAVEGFSRATKKGIATTSAALTSTPAKPRAKGKAKK